MRTLSFEQIEMRFGGLTAESGQQPGHWRRVVLVASLHTRLKRLLGELSDRAVRSNEKSGQAQTGFEMQR